MILTCPSCSTRYSVDGAKFPAAGRTVRCAKCGHSWHQAGEEPAPEPAPEIPAEVPAAAMVAPAETAASSDSFSAHPSPPRAYASAPPEPGAPWGPKLAVGAGWAALIAVVLVIAVSAVRYRQNIALIWPQS